MSELEMEPVRVEPKNVAMLMQFLHKYTRGPKEAYALLCTTLWCLNFKFTDDPVSIDQLCAEVEHSLRSLKEGPYGTNA